MGSWPPTITLPTVHPHQLVLLVYNRNACNICRGVLAGSLGYRCEACNFDVHCACLPPNNPGAGSGSSRGGQQPWPPHHAAAQPPPRAPPATPSHAAGAHHHQYGGAAYPPVNPAASRWPRLNLSLSEQFNHQPGGTQNSPNPAPSPNNGYRARQDYGAPQNYDHLQQQNYYQTTNSQQRGDYGVPDSSASYDYLQQQNFPTTDDQNGYYTRSSDRDVDDYDNPLDDMDDY